MTSALMVYKIPKLTSWNLVTFMNLVVVQVLNIFPVYCVTRKRIAVFTNPVLDSFRQSDGSISTCQV